MMDYVAVLTISFSEVSDADALAATESFAGAFVDSLRQGETVEYAVERNDDGGKIGQGRHEV